MNYTIHQLEILVKVVELESVTKAAAALHLSQPAVSIQLKNFQQQFEIPLLEVINRRLYVTDFGREIAATAVEILQLAETIELRSRDRRGQLVGRLKFSVVSTAKYVIPYFLKPFFSLHPGVELSLDVTNKRQVVESLHRNEVDFSLVSILPTKPQVEHIDLLDNRLFLVSHPSLPQGSRPQPANFLKNYPMIFRESGSGTRQTMEDFMRGSGVGVQPRWELTGNEAVKQAIMADLGFSIVPLIGIRNELQLDQLKIVPLKGLPIRTSWQLIWLKGKRFSPAATAFVEYINEEKEAIAREHFGWTGEY